MRLSRFVVCSAALQGALVLVAGAVQTQDWSQWRGPARDGQVRTFTPPAEWPARATQAWKVPAGIGHASPVVAGDRVFQFSRIGEQEAMTAFELATGKQVWRQAYDAPYRMNPAATGHGKGPKGTPTVAGGRIHTLGISGILSAFDAATGRVLWRHDFANEFTVTSPDFGASMSPIVDGAHVIAHVGGAGGGALAAFDVATGSRVWSWKGDGPAYASPVIATAGGVRQLITQTQSHLVGLDVSNGKELWRMPFTTDYDQNIVTSIVDGDVIVYGGLSKPTVAARIVNETGGWKLSEVWRNPDVPMYMSSPVAQGGVLYGFTHRNRGQFFALDMKTGRTLWTGPPRQGDNASLSVAGRFVLAVTTEGALLVMRQESTAFDLVRTYTVADSPVWAHPAFTARGILVKDMDALALWTF
jgi:outer membrane protein assembly factor BamB